MSIELFSAICVGVVIGIVVDETLRFFAKSKSDKSDIGDFEYFNGIDNLVEEFDCRGVKYKFEEFAGNEFIIVKEQVLRCKGGDDRGAVYFSSLRSFKKFKAGHVDDDTATDNESF